MPIYDNIKEPDAISFDDLIKARNILFEICEALKTDIRHESNCKSLAETVNFLNIHSVNISQMKLNLINS